MTQEDKEFLLKDLSARTLYGVKVKLTLSDGTSFEDTLLSYKRLDHWLWDNTLHNKLYEGIRPYLRPMLSITEEEKEELSHLLPKDWSVEIDKLNNFYLDMSPSIFVEIDVFLNIIDWLNRHYFDYRGLIEKGLAIAVTEENNPYE